MYPGTEPPRNYGGAAARVGASSLTEEARARRLSGRGGYEAEGEA